MEIVRAGELYIPSPGIEPWSPVLQAESLPLSHQGSPVNPLFPVSNPQWLPTFYGTSSMSVSCHLQCFSVNRRLPPQPHLSQLSFWVSLTSAQGDDCLWANIMSPGTFLPGSLCWKSIPPHPLWEHLLLWIRFLLTCIIHGFLGLMSL